MNSMFLPPDHLRLPPGPATLPGFDNPRAEPEHTGLAALVRCWVRRFRERRELGGLTPRDLRDIRVSASEARAEMAKPFWRA